MKTLISILSIAALVISCKATNENTSELKRLFFTSDQSKICYTSCGNGETNLLFVHGWNIDKTYWAGQQEFFSDDFKIIALDLPGFGESVNLRKEYSIASYAKDVNHLIQHLELKNVVLIGHSMGGRIILEAAQQNHSVTSLIGVDNFKEVSQVLTDEIQKEADGFIDWLKADFKTNAQVYADQYLIHADADSLVRDRIVNDYGNANPETSIPAISAYFNYLFSEEERLSNLDIPLFLISSGMSPVDTIGLKNTGLDYQVYEINKSGHFPMIEQPKLFNTYLAAALKEIGVK